MQPSTIDHLYDYARGQVDSHAAVKVHSVDTDCRIILDAQIDVFADPETEVARLGEVSLSQLVFLDLQATLQDLLCLWSPDGDMYGDLLVTTNTECSYSVACLACSEQSVLALANERSIFECCALRFSSGVMSDGRHTVYRCLSTQLFQHLRRTGESVPSFANGNVQDEFLDAELPHGVRGLIFPGLGL